MADIERVLSSGISIVVAVVLTGVGVWALRKDKFEQEHWVEQRVKVVEGERTRDKKEWAGSFEFEVNGRRIQHTTPYGSQRFTSEYETIRFDPADPENTVRVRHAYEDLAVPSALALAGASFIAGVVGLFRKRKSAA